jgi:putative ABC transport system substrate-binding protein
VSGSDPVKAGPVAGFNRSGDNVTGASFVATELETKRLEILRDVAPTAAVIGVLINPSNPTAESRSKDLETLDHVDRLRRAFDLCRVNLAGCSFVFVSL